MVNKMIKSVISAIIHVSSTNVFLSTLLQNFKMDPVPAKTVSLDGVLA